MNIIIINLIYCLLLNKQAYYIICRILKSKIPIQIRFINFIKLNQEKVYFNHSFLPNMEVGTFMNIDKKNRPL